MFMAKKDKVKKTNPKREKYTKFRKDKPTNMAFTTPDLPEEAVTTRRDDEKRIDSFWKFYRRPAERFNRDRDAKAKR